VEAGPDCTRQAVRIRVVADHIRADHSQAVADHIRADHSQAGAARSQEGEADHSPVAVDHNRVAAAHSREEEAGIAQMQPFQRITKNNPGPRPISASKSP